MWMEFQGKKATHDFLSLYTKDSSFQHQVPRPPPEGLFLKTHDFLKPLEKTVEAGDVVGPSARVVEPTAERVAHVLPVRNGTYIGHVACGGSVKPEEFTCSPNGPHVMARKPEPDSVGGGFGSCAGVAFTLWESNDNRTNRGGQWPPAFAARTATSFASLSPSRNQPAHDKKRLMESGSRSSRCFDDEEDEDDGFSRRETHKGEMSMKAGGKGGNDQRATTPRSKHSATEQRRRSKINDRFQILRDLIPHSDQKRDKASFLLEVIEYIRFLQEKVHNYESSYPGCNEENAKLMPWSSGHVPGGNVEPSQIMKNGASEFIFSGKFDDNSMPVATAMLSSAQNPVESDLSAGVSYKGMENSTGFTNNVAVAPIPLHTCSYASNERGTGVAQPQPGLISDIDNLASQSQSQWLRPSCPADCSVSSDLLNGQEELTIDEGTINVSTAYSQNLLNTLNQALESSGIDLSQANVSVHINLGKRSTNRGPAAAATTMGSAKDLDNPSSGNQGVMGHSRVGSSGEESERGTKRHKPDS